MRFLSRRVRPPRFPLRRCLRRQVTSSRPSHSVASSWLRHPEHRSLAVRDVSLPAPCLAYTIPYPGTPSSLALTCLCVQRSIHDTGVTTDVTYHLRTRGLGYPRQLPDVMPVNSWLEVATLQVWFLSGLFTPRTGYPRGKSQTLSIRAQYSDSVSRQYPGGLRFPDVSHLTTLTGGVIPGLSERSVAGPKPIWCPVGERQAPARLRYGWSRYACCA